MNFTPKTAAAGLGGYVSVVILWIVGLILSHWSITIPPEIAAAFTAIISTIASYFAPRSPHPADNQQPTTQQP